MRRKRFITTKMKKKEKIAGISKDSLTATSPAQIESNFIFARLIMLF